MDAGMTEMKTPLRLRLPRLIYGTTRLGHADVPMESRLKVARAAMAADIWFHTSRQYGDALETLAEAFKDSSSRIPPLICKIGGGSIEELRQSIRDNLDPLGLDSMTVGQLCLHDGYAEDFARGGKALRELLQLKEEGLVEHFVMEVFPWTSTAPLAALESGVAKAHLEAFIFYLNPLQRFASNALWQKIHEAGFPVIAMRTICGAPVHALRDKPGAAWVPYLQERAVEVAPVFEASGITDWTEFCVRFAFSFPNVIGTVGSTSQMEHLHAFLSYQKMDTIEAFPDETMHQLLHLQEKWSDTVDVHAEPWTM